MMPRSAVPEPKPVAPSFFDETKAGLQAERKAAIDRQGERQARRAALLALVRDIESSITERDAALASLAEQPEAFAAATSAIASEEDRRRALVDKVIPAVEAEIQAAAADVGAAELRLWVLSGLQADLKIRDADRDLAEKLQAATEALANCLSVRQAAEAKASLRDTQHMGVLVPRDLEAFLFLMSPGGRLFRNFALGGEGFEERYYKRFHGLATFEHEVLATLERVTPTAEATQVAEFRAAEYAPPAEPESKPFTAPVVRIQVDEAPRANPFAGGRPTISSEGGDAA